MVNDEFYPYNSHAAWFMQRAGHPRKEPHAGALEQYWASRARRAKREGRPPLDWKCAGPFNIAGRVTSLIAHPTEQDTLYAGAATGGVWRTRDGGLNWEPCWPAFTNLNIGALAFDPANPRTIYCGTGEANLSPDCYPGSGLFVTRDGGDKWRLLADAGTTLPRRIGVVYPDPNRPGRILVGGVSQDEQHPGGLFRSEDGGKRWKREEFFSRYSYRCHAVVSHPDGSIFAAVDLSGPQTGVWRIGAKGREWERLGKGMPAGEQIGRISLAIAPSNPDMLYALAGGRRGKKVLGVYRSQNGGETWENTGGEPFADEDQARYNNTIAVHPENPDIVACGISDIFVSRDGGRSWRHSSSGDQEGVPAYVHFDQHALVLRGEAIFAANDGGIFYSGNMGETWEARARGMCTTMFYDVDAAPTDGRLLCGGTQDNGNLLTGANGKPGDWTRILAGDGAWSVFDPKDAGHVFASTSNARISRHRGRNWGPKSWIDKTPSPHLLSDEEHNQVSIAVMALDPQRSRTVWFGSRRMWRSADDGDTWQPLSEVLDGSPITAIEIPSAAPEQVWVGTLAGGIYRSLDRGKSWSEDISGPGIPGRFISRIESHPKTARKLVATVAGTGIVTRLGGASGQIGRAHLFGHVFYTEDAGQTWRAIDSPEMPDVPFNAAVFETHEPHRLFVACDCGVWITEDMAHWTDASDRLPAAMVSDLVYHHKDRALIAATYGRGIWKADVPRGV
jgi:photosystem II stability/assembly factor-like uncharacterized protein